MDLTRFQTIDSTEISQIMEKAVLFGGEVEQPTLTSNKICPIKNIHIDTMGMIRIELFEDFDSENARHIKIQLNYRKLFFHLMPGQFRSEGCMLVTNVPRVVKAIAIRDTDRYVMSPHSPVITSIYRIERRGDNPEINVQVLDVSRKGFALTLSEQAVEEKTFIKNDHIWIKSLNGRPLERPLFGTIVYLLGNKMGVALDAYMPEEIFQELQGLSQIILSA